MLWNIDNLVETLLLWKTRVWVLFYVFWSTLGRELVEKRVILERNGVSAEFFCF